MPTQTVCKWSWIRPAAPLSPTHFLPFSHSVKAPFTTLLQRWRVYSQVFSQKFSILSSRASWCHCRQFTFILTWCRYGRQIRSTDAQSGTPDPIRLTGASMFKNRMNGEIKIRGGIPFPGDTVLADHDSMLDETLDSIAPTRETKSDDISAYRKGRQLLAAGTYGWMALDT